MPIRTKHRIAVGDFFSDVAVTSGIQHTYTHTKQKRVRQTPSTVHINGITLVTIYSPSLHIREARMDGKTAFGKTATRVCARFLKRRRVATVLSSKRAVDYRISF